MKIKRRALQLLSQVVGHHMYLMILVGKGLGYPENSDRRSTGQRNGQTAAMAILKRLHMLIPSTVFFMLFGHEFKYKSRIGRTVIREM
jgi:hypothetical protein